MINYSTDDEARNGYGPVNEDADNANYQADPSDDNESPYQKFDNPKKSPYNAANGKHDDNRPC